KARLRQVHDTESGRGLLLVEAVFEQGTERLVGWESGAVQDRIPEDEHPMPLGMVLGAFAMLAIGRFGPDRHAMQQTEAMAAHDLSRRPRRPPAHRQFAYADSCGATKQQQPTEHGEMGGASGEARWFATPHPSVAPPRSHG